MKAERTCIGCRACAPKGELFRIVRTPGRAMAFDASGNQPGRGAYVCSSECFDRAVASKRFASALRTKADAAVLERIGYELRCAESAGARGSKER